MYFLSILRGRTPKTLMCASGKGLVSLKRVVELEKQHIPSKVRTAELADGGKDKLYLADLRPMTIE
jgi:hypothetical protein